MRSGRGALRPLLALALGAGALVVPAALAVPGSAAVGTPLPVPRVLVFSGAYGYRHTAITSSDATIVRMGAASQKYVSTVTENPADLTAANLASYDVLLFNSTTGKTPLTDQQRDQLIRWVGCGGGFVGIHAAADANYGWTDYADLIGAQFLGHPHVAGSGKPATVIVENRSAPVNAAFTDDKLVMDEELYRWRRDPRGDDGLQVVLSLDETSLSPAVRADNIAYVDRQPLAWTRTFRGGGRVFYTNLGHDNASWGRADFPQSIADGIGWVSGKRPDVACALGTAPIPAYTAHAPAVPPLDPSAPAPAPCPLPTTGFGVAAQSAAWIANGPLKRLGVAGDSQSLAAGSYGGGKPGMQTYVLDLGAAGSKADVTVRSTWTGASDDYDLSVVVPWQYGSHAQQPADPNGETVVLRDVPSCTRIDAYGDNEYAFTGSGPRLTVTVAPKP